MFEGASSFFHLFPRFSAAAATDRYTSHSTARPSIALGSLFLSGAKANCRGIWTSFQAEVLTGLMSVVSILQPAMGKSGQVKTGSGGNFDNLISKLFSCIILIINMLQNKMVTLLPPLPLFICKSPARFRVRTSGRTNMLMLIASRSILFMLVSHICCAQLEPINKI